MNAQFFWARRILQAVVLAAEFATTGSILAQAPSILEQPQSQTVEYGSDVAFSVSAVGSGPLNYQWQKDGVNLADYENVAGSRSPTLYLVGVGEQDARNYKVIVTDADGFTRSSIVTLTVDPATVFEDNFEGGLGQWQPLLGSAAMAVESSKNHTSGGALSASSTNSSQAMFHSINPKLMQRARMTFWLYDPGDPAAIAYGEMRGYSGRIGYAKYISSGGLGQAFSIGIAGADFGTNNTGALAGEVYDPAKYQGRILKGTNAGWFNLNGPQSPGRSPGWHCFQINRTASQTSVDFYVDGIWARTIQGVKPAKLDTVIIGSKGLETSNAPTSFFGAASFDDVKVEAYQPRYTYNTMETMGSIPDVIQFRQTGTNANVVSVVPATVCEVVGMATNASVGSWAPNGTAIYATGLRGQLDYALTAPADDVYRVEIEGREKDFKTPEVELPLEISVDGEYLDRFNLAYTGSSNGLLHCFTPFLRAGSHVIRLAWDNGAPDRSLYIKAVRLQTLTPPGFSGSGFKAWVVNRLLTECAVEYAPESSPVSPVCVEGRDPYLSMMTLSVGTNYPLQTAVISHGAGYRWYANIPLSPNSPTRIEVTHESGAVKETNDLAWQITNLLEARDMVLRKGDSLLLMAAPSGQSSGNVFISINGTPFITTDASQPAPCQFDQAGNFVVAGVFTPTGATGQMRVKVIDATLEESLPSGILIPNSWICTNLPADVTMDPDPRLKLIDVSASWRLTNASNLGTNDREFNLSTSSIEHRYILARLGVKGPIIASCAVMGFRSFIPPETDFYVSTNRPDGSQLINGTFILSPVLPRISEQINLVESGVIFSDGTISKTLEGSDFDSLGVCHLQFVRSLGTPGSACMLPQLYRDTKAIGWH